MAIVRWDPVMRSGLEFMDADHKALLDAIAHLDVLIQAGRLADEGTAAFHELVGHARTHFAEEEAYMRSTAHAGYIQHKMEHDDFLDHLDRFERQFGRGGIAMHEDMLRFVSLWFLGHILGTDRTLGDHRHNKAAA